MSWITRFQTHCFQRYFPCGPFILALVLFTGDASANPSYSMSDFQVNPINIVENAARPIALINTSNDHQLFFKAYNDYSDLNKDGVIETTYTHSVDYYGYFDNKKCYKYNTAEKIFKPDSVSEDKYCNVGAASGQWSGNFLNWASMSRIDAIRKILFGGHRRVDTATTTILERTYLPHDAHSWAKYYNGSDLEKLTPFVSGVDYNCDAGDLTFDASGEPTSAPALCMDGVVIDKKKFGITIGNTSDVDMTTYKGKYSEDYSVPPLVKVVKGNFSLWGSNERWQITWKSGSPVNDNHTGDNSNDPVVSKIYAYPSNPDYATHGIGNKEYIARVQACVNALDSNGKSLLGAERCRLYPGPDGISGNADDNYKPIGLIQVYGEGVDKDKMDFGMIAGTYGNHATGGDLISQVGDVKGEIDIDKDGRFLTVAVDAGGHEANNQAKGLINAWSLYRIIGYDGDDGTYNSNQGDNCSWGLSKFADVTAPNACQNWGNPFSEIYYQSINYLASGGVIGAYRSNDSNKIDGLNQPLNFPDPLTTQNSCARLSVVNFNSSVSSYDADQMDQTSYKPTTIWNSVDLPDDKSTKAMTDFIGDSEGIHGKQYYVGETTLVDTGVETDDQMCTEKKITSFGNTGGICPEAPRLEGSYKVAGVAYYAHVKDIRPDNATGNRGLDGPQIVDTYSVELATSLPTISVPDPENPATTLITIIPACRNTALTPNGNCAIVDFKVVERKIDTTLKKATGRAYVNWEDSEQGGDYDQDMWGTISYEFDKSTNQIKITTDVNGKSTPYAMGFGYILGGTGSDGFHAHSGINDYVNTEAADAGFVDCRAPGCTDVQIASQKTYSRGAAPAQLLKSPLWYASKWGGFLDSNDNNMPDLDSEWDAENNSTGEPVPDGLPDTYFLASNPQELEDALDRVLSAILERTSSGTAAAVVSSNVRGEGAMFQAFYEPLKKDGEKEARWIGTLQAMWLDKFGLTRQDCSPPSVAVYNPDTATECPATPLTCGAPNGKLDDYCVDNVVESYFDDLQNRTRVRIFKSDQPGSFAPFSMQGVIKKFTKGSLASATAAVVMEPNSMQGNAHFDGTTLEISPYYIKGKVTAYNETDGTVVMSVAAGDWKGPLGPFDSWEVSTSSGPGLGFSISSIELKENDTLSFTVNPAGPWIVAEDTVNGIPGDILTLKTKSLVGASGEAYDDWVVKCLDPVGAQGEVNGAGLQMNNSSTDVVTIVNVQGSFGGCTRAKIMTYNLRGTAGEIYSEWQVSNLETLLGKGESISSIKLSNSEDISFDVSPNSDWLKVGNGVLVANYTSTTRELNEINYLWNGREKLYLPGITETELKNNRTYSANAGGAGRYITTWIDSNLNGMVGSGEYVDFEEGLVNGVNYNFFDVPTQGDAKNVINYVRGFEVPGTRNRSIRYSGNNVNVMRLGDIINSTPTVVAAPQEGFDILYNDTSFNAYRRQYLNRRVMVYVGGNDGLLHAFNGGFYNVINGANGKETVEYSVKGKKIDGVTDAAQHDLGSEIWAYAPKNLLSHLQWLKDPAYARSHVYYIDGKPRVFDANIFNTDPNHPSGWGTVMVVGMNLGGGRMDVDADVNQNGSVESGELTSLRSSYVVFDVTNPEEEPKLLGEIPLPDGSFSTVYPAVIAFRDINGEKKCTNGTTACNKWYLQFGTGPNNLETYESNQNAKMYLFDLSQLITSSATPITTEIVPAGCSVGVLAPTTYNVITCDTGVEGATSFMGAPSVVDWDLDFYADTSYFGLIGKKDINGETSKSGRVMRFDFNNKIKPSDWDPLRTFYNPERPVNAQPVPALDNLDNKWVFFGTGRYFSADDKLSTAPQALFGIKDRGNDLLVTDKLVDVSNVEVFSDGTLQTSMTSIDGSKQLTKFEELEKDIDDFANGWKLILPPIIGDSTFPSTRNVNRSTLAGGVLFSSVFQPSENPCAGEGRSRLYGLYYKTGTAYPDPSVFGSNIISDNSTVKYQSRKFIELGRGFATSPALHSGSGTGTGGVRVFTQLSTGDIVETTAETIENVRTGKTSWSDR